MVDLVPYMMNVVIQFALGNKILSNHETRYVIADNHQVLDEKISWGTLAKMPMETVIVFKLYIYAKEGEGDIVGVGALKLFD